MYQTGRKYLISQLNSITEDNVSIGDVAISRRRLLEALKLQTQPSAEVVTLSYGRAKWQAYDKEGRPLSPVDADCLQVSCDHTVMRFLNCPKQKHNYNLPIKPIAFGNPVENELTGTPFNPQELIEALEYTLIATAREESRPVLCCILFDKGQLVAADGFRLGVYQLEGIEGKFLIHDSDIANLIKFLKAIKPEGKGKSKIYPEIYLSTTETKVQFTTARDRIEFIKRDGNFPNYAQLIPKEGITSMFMAEDMLQAVKSVSTTAKDGSGIVQLYFAEGKITIKAKSEDTGDTEVNLPARVESECKIAFNHHYLIDFLRKVKGKVSVRVQLPSDPAVFTTDKVSYTVMPMFVQWGK